LKGVSTWIWIIGGIIISFVLFSLFLKVFSDMTIEKHRQSTMESFDMLVLDVNSFCKKPGLEYISSKNSFSDFTQNIYASDDGKYNTDADGFSHGTNLCVEFRNDIECKPLECDIYVKTGIESKNLDSLLESIGGKINFKEYEVSLEREETGEVKAFIK
jgi:hypothetical protein